MLKECLSIGICGSLAVFIGIQSGQWLEGQSGLDSQAALHCAEKAAIQGCRHHGYSTKTMRLVDETAPRNGQDTWTFSFNTSSQKHGLTIQVDGHGRAWEVLNRTT